MLSTIRNSIAIAGMITLLVLGVWLFSAPLDPDHNNFMGRLYTPFMTESHVHSPAYQGADVSYLEKNDQVITVCDREPDGRGVYALASIRGREAIVVSDNNGSFNGCVSKDTNRNNEYHTTFERIENDTDKGGASSLHPN